MPRARPRKPAVRFVKALAAGQRARAEGDHFVAEGSGVRLPADEVRRLASAGVLREEAGALLASAEAGAWLRRALVDADAYAAQHRTEVRSKEGVISNLAESPLARLASAANGESPFLARHHVEAGERFRRLVERAQLRTRVTMSYSGSHTAGGGRGAAADITEMAADARRALADVWRVLPRDCAEVVLDVCGLMKGLQTVEAERGWPRRSAKLVLRIGLEQLAAHYGLAPEAVGASTRRAENWIAEGARPTRFE